MEQIIREFEKNGKPYEEYKTTCSRCGGAGKYYIAVHNGQGVPAHPDGGTCYRCGGTGYEVRERRILSDKEKAQRERTKLRKELKRIAEAQEKQAKWESHRKEIEEAKAQREKEKAERVAALKARSQYQGNVGEKLTAEVIMKLAIEFEPKEYGWGRSYIYIFEDEAGNCYKWTTSKYLSWQKEEIGQETKLRITGTIKEHTEYKDQKQTVLTRCKIEEVK